MIQRILLAIARNDQPDAALSYLVNDVVQRRQVERGLLSLFA